MNVLSQILKWSLCQKICFFIDLVLFPALTPVLYIQNELIYNYEAKNFDYIFSPASDKIETKLTLYNIIQKVSFLI
jgi:hypothetical protein